MSRNKLFIFLISLSLFALACNFGGLLNTPTPTAPPPTAPPTKVTTTQSGDMAGLLERLNGAPCEENPDFTCVTIPVPLNHFDAANTETINVAFAVSQATGERYGMFAQAFPGGPGGEGISSGGLGWFPDGILEHFDLVYFDQRGLGLSGELACPKAYAKDFSNYLNYDDSVGEEGYDTPAEQQDAIDEARTFVDSCVSEIGIDPARLVYYGTNQVAEDIESFRQLVGDDKFWLYGVSYGTSVAQIYAAAHADHLAGLILDGTIDLTLNGEEGALAQEKAFDEVLVATLKACDADESCAAELGGNALAAYDSLASKLAEKPIAYEYPLASGKKVKKKFTFSQLEFTASYQMYALGGRMLFLRALASANEGDMVPMARLLYQQATVDPAADEYLGDSTFSDTMFYSVNCTDDSYFSGTQEERIAQTIEAGQASNGTVPRLDGSVYTGLYCAYWPSAPKEFVTREPLTAAGVPTFVLNATLDPATPFAQGKAVFDRLDNGYHLYVEGGRHSIYGFGNECPDDYITNFMVNGQLPEQREIICEWDPSVISAYVPRMSANASEFDNPLDIFSAIETELSIEPEYYYNGFTEDTSFACPYGGAFTFGPSDAGESYSFTDCEYTQGFAITGAGSFNYDTRIFTLETKVSGDKAGALNYISNYNDGSITLTGEYGGETINLSQ
ncbi:MAG TPA: alpha/beta fold hydrolase [Anaerolineales bacterium]|jgi:pimeloyl-ACP methyl ester carboxylesterase|nr:alpha/beta fold hydrolase [Anaerolineales bacterium]